MTRRDVQALHTKEPAELIKLLQETKAKRREALLELAQLKAKNTKRLQATRKEIAQILTILKEKEMKHGKNA